MHAWTGIVIMSASMVGVLACNNSAATAPRRVLTPTFAVAASDPAAAAELQGVVMGHPSGGGSAAPVSGVVVNIFHLELVAGGGPTDTAANQTPQLIGSVTTGADGTFAVTNIPAGTYAIDAVPATSSPYGETDLWTFVSTGSNDQSTTVDLYPRQAQSLAGTP